MWRRVAHRRPVSGSSQATEPTGRGQRSSYFVASVERGPVLAVLIGALQLQHRLASTVALEPFVDNCRAGNVAAQLFERLALIGWARFAS